MAVNVYDFLLHRWEDIFGQSQKSIDVFSCVLVEYSKNHRHYHKPAHIMDVLLSLDTAMPSCDPRLSRGDCDMLDIAAFMHDVIYVPGKSDNEMRSAEFAHGALRNLDVSDSFAGRIGDLICETKHHNPKSSDVLAAYLCDADLDILSSSRARYVEYALGVRFEYIEYSDADWIKGRSAFLTEMLERVEIYHVETNRVLEGIARHNMEFELRRLQEGRILGEVAHV